MTGRNLAQAEQIWRQQQPARATAERGGYPLTSIMTATVEQIEAHLDLCDRLARDLNARVDAARCWGMTEAEIVASVQARVKKAKRSAGARALVSKYGKDAAERIIERQTGRSYSLKG